MDGNEDGIIRSPRKNSKFRFLFIYLVFIFIGIGVSLGFVGSLEKSKNKDNEIKVETTRLVFNLYEQKKEFSKENYHDLLIKKRISL